MVEINPQGVVWAVVYGLILNLIPVPYSSPWLGHLISS